MNPDIQDTLLQLFEQVRQDSDTIPTMPVNDWQDGSAEWQLLTSFNSMLEQLQQRTLQLMRTEQQLREKEEQYRSIFEATLDGLTISDLETGIIIETNPANYGMFGYTYEEMIGLSPSDIVPPDYLPLVGEGLQTIMAGGRNDLVMVAQRKDGTRFPVEVHSTLFTYKGKPHLLSASRGITERVEAEQQLREREEQYRTIFEASTDALMIGDLEDGHIVEANPAAYQMYGYSYEEFIGLGPNDVTAHDYQHLPGEARQIIKEGGQFQTRGVALHKDGSTFYVEAHGTPFTYKGKPHQLASVRNITEQVQAEQRLHEKEEQYRGVFEATNDSLNILDSDGIIVEVNPAFCSMYGYTHDEIIGLHASRLTLPEYFPALAESLNTVYAGGRYQTQGLALRKDGTTFHVEAHSATFIYQGKPHLLGVSRDITERVEAEQQLREKERQYRAIFEATSDGLIIRNMDGFVVEANPAAYTMHGYTYQEFLGMHRTDIIAPEDHSMVAEYMKAIQDGRAFRGQAVDLRKDRSAFPVEVRGSLFTYLGKPHTLSVLRDITERIQAEQQIREREEQYRSIFEATTDGLFITDFEDGHLIEVNPAACRMHGYSYEEFIALHPTAFIHPNSHHLFAEYLQTVRVGGQFHARAYDIRKDGTTFPVEVYGTTFIYKSMPHVLGIVRDITKQVQAEQQLREKEEQYRSVFEATYDALFIMDLDGFIVEVNPAFCSLFGSHYEEVIGLHASVFTAPESLPSLADSLETFKTGRGSQTAVGVALRKDGTSFFVESQSTTFTYRGKLHALGVIRDITERVQAQQLLEQRVEERTRELSTLLEVSHNVASTLELKSLLGLILEQLKTVADYDGATITIVDGEHLVIIDYRGYGRESMLGWRFPLKQLGLIWETICRQEVVIVEDVYGDAPLALAYRQAVGDLLSTVFAPTRTWMAIPMMLKERVMGMLNLSSRKPSYFTTRHATLALGIAAQAAVAIENVRLYEQAQELAAVEERQRLARELHDSVSQALYGISLGVHTARLQLDHNPGELAESLDYVLELAEAALTEMRALIFELRPESLEAEGLVAALTKQAAALHARQGITVELDLCNEPDLTLKVKRELYRVAQEALHNTVKHAEASKVDLRLHVVDGVVILEVRDNGKGFEATGSFPGHLGLHSMRERIESLDGGLHIESAPGQGTSIRAHIPTRKTTKLIVGE